MMLAEGPENATLLSPNTFLNFLLITNNKETPTTD